MKNLSIVISGSFRKNLAGIQEKIREFERLGFRVLSPALSSPVDLNEEFVLLENDKSTDPKTLEQQHLDAIEQATALYLFNPGGYLGDSSKMEMGYALCARKPIYAKEEIPDVTLKLFCKVVTPEQIRDALTP